MIQIRLAQYNIDAAEKEVSATKRWAQDSLLSQLAEVKDCMVTSFNNRHGLRLQKAATVSKERIIFMKN